MASAAIASGLPPRREARDEEGSGKAVAGIGVVRQKVG
jgi:hypothetical protein